MPVGSGYTLVPGLPGVPAIPAIPAMPPMPAMPAMPAGMYPMINDVAYYVKDDPAYPRQQFERPIPPYQVPCHNDADGWQREQRGRLGERPDFEYDVCRVADTQGPRRGVRIQLSAAAWPRHAQGGVCANTQYYLIVKTATFPYNQFIAYFL